MTEYWKSQARKYCDFCKCWLADNKVSVSFHENGKRHKENVQKHISTLTKKSTKDLKQKEKIDDDIKKMEAAAMAAYLKDVQNNADLTSQSINEMLGRGSSSIPASPSLTTNNTPSTTTEAPSTTPNTPMKREPVWHEVKSEGGNYYWNTDTNATTWDPPDDYLSLAQQQEKELKQKDQEKKKEKKEEKQKKQKQKEKYVELNAHIARERMRELAAEPLEPAAPAPATDSIGPAPRAHKPYGSWTAVVTQPAEQVDLQLPKVQVVPPPVVMQPEERFTFRERTVDSLGDGPVQFKRRKIAGNRSMRQKTGDD